jgi:hypothetical protein
MGIVGQVDGLDGPDGLPRNQHLVAADELAAVLEDQVVLAAGASAEEENEHENEPGEEGPASRQPGDPRPPADSHSLGLRRHPVRGGPPLLLNLILRASGSSRWEPFPGRSRLPRHERDLLAAHPTSIPQPPRKS